MKRTVKGKNGDITFNLLRRKVKKMTLRVRQDGTVTVSAGKTVPLWRIDLFVTANEAFIGSARRKIEEKYPKSLSEYENGATVLLWGKSYILSVCAGKSGVTVTEDEILLSLPKPEDAAARRKCMRAFYKAECERVIGRLCREAMPFFGRVSFPTVTYRRMVSRWGSCLARTNRLSFNISLATVGVDIANYVVFHEFTHFLQQNHSPRFYAELEKRMPDWKARRIILNREGRFV